MRLLAVLVVLASTTAANAMTYEACVSAQVIGFKAKREAYEQANQNFRDLNSGPKAANDAQSATLSAVKREAKKLRELGAKQHQAYLSALADYCETLR